MYATVNGAKIFFDIEGLEYVPDGAKMRQRPVCFVLHGGPGGDHANFLPGFSKMAETMQLIYVDDRNCGRSERVDIATSSIKQNVDDIEALRKYLGLDKVFVCGHSYGGMKAQRYMIDYPDSLHGVILIDCRPNCEFAYRVDEIVRERGTPEQIEMHCGNKLLTGEVTYKEYMAATTSLYHYKCNTPEEKQAALDGMNRCIKNAEVTRYQREHDMKDINMVPELEKTHVPTLILVGKYDHITPVEYSQLMHKAMPHSELHIIEDAAHECFCDRPDYVFPCVADFVNRNFKPEE